MIAWILGCQGPSDVTTPAPEPQPVAPTPVPQPQPQPVTPTDTAETADTAPTTVPCTGVQALFFDLGETLVTEVNDIFQPIPGAAEVIADLRADGYRLGLITNTLPGWDQQDLAELLANPGVLDQFEVVLLESQASSPPKPSPAIFLEAHGMMIGAPPIGQVAFVTEETGDSADQAQSPSEGARAAGMYGVLVDDQPSSLADATIGDLSEIATAPWLCR